MKDVKQIFAKNITKLNVKTSGFLEVSKLSTYISSIEKEIEEKKRELAELICQEWELHGEIPQERLPEILDDIQMKKVLIEEQRRKIEEVEESQKKILGTQTDPGQGFSEAEQEDMIYCSECGSANSKNNNFCRKCGNRLEH